MSTLYQQSCKAEAVGFDRPFPRLLHGCAQGDESVFPDQDEIRIPQDLHDAPDQFDAPVGGLLARFWKVRAC